MLRGPFLLPRVCPAELRGSQQEELHPKGCLSHCCVQAVTTPTRPARVSPPPPAPLIIVTLASSCSLSLVRGDQRGKVGWCEQSITGISKARSALGEAASRLLAGNQARRSGGWCRAEGLRPGHIPVHTDGSQAASGVSSPGRCICLPSALGCTGQSFR